MFHHASTKQILTDLLSKHLWLCCSMQKNTHITHVTASLSHFTYLMSITTNFPTATYGVHYKKKRDELTFSNPFVTFTLFRNVVCFLLHVSYSHWSWKAIFVSSGLLLSSPASATLRSPLKHSSRRGFLQGGAWELQAPPCPMPISATQHTTGRAGWVQAQQITEIWGEKPLKTRPHWNRWKRFITIKVMGRFKSPPLSPAMQNCCP